MSLLVRFKPTGQLGEIPENEFDPTIYDIVNQETQEEPQSFLGRVGKGALDIGKSVVSPFARTGENFLDAATTQGQALVAGGVGAINPQAGAQIASKDILGTQSRAAKKVTNPEDLIRRQIADSLEIGAYTIPFGKARKGAGLAERAITKAALPGALTGAMTSDESVGLILGEDINEDEFVGSVLLGAAIPVAVQGLAKAARGVRKAGKILTSGSETAAEKAIGVTKTQHNNFTEKFKQDVGEFSRKRGLQGLTADQLQDDVIDIIQNQYDDVARRSGIQVTRQQFDDVMYDYIEPLIMSGSTDDVALARKLLNEYDEVIKATKLNKGSVDISKITNLKTNFAKKTKNWLGNPIEGGKNRVMSTALNETSQVAADATGMKLGEIMSDLGKELQRLYTFKDIVNTQAGKGRGTLPIGLMKMLGIGSGGAIAGAPGAMGAVAVTEIINNPKSISLMSKLMDKAGTGLSKAPGITPSPAFLKGATQTGLRISDLDREAPVKPEESTLLPTTPALDKGSLTGYTPQELYSAYQQALMAGDKSSASTLRTMYNDEVEYQESGVNKKMSVSEATRAETANMITRLAQQYEQNKDKLGITAGYTSGTLSKLNLADQDVADFYNTASQLKASIAKSRAGTSFTPNEERLLNQYTPKRGDSKQELETKIRGLLYLAQGPLSVGITSEDLTELGGEE